MLGNLQASSVAPAFGRTNWEYGDHYRLTRREKKSKFLAKKAHFLQVMFKVYTVDEKKPAKHQATHAVFIPESKNPYLDFAKEIPAVKEVVLGLQGAVLQLFSMKGSRFWFISLVKRICRSCPWMETGDKYYLPFVLPASREPFYIVLRKVSSRLFMYESLLTQSKLLKLYEDPNDQEAIEVKGKLVNLKPYDLSYKEMTAPIAISKPIFAVINKEGMTTLRIRKSKQGDHYDLAYIYDEKRFYHKSELPIYKKVAASKVRLARYIDNVTGEIRIVMRIPIPQLNAKKGKICIFGLNKALKDGEDCYVADFLSFDTWYKDAKSFMQFWKIALLYNIIQCTKKAKIVSQNENKLVSNLFFQNHDRRLAKNRLPEAPVNGGRNCKGPKVAKFLVG